MVRVISEKLFSPPRSRHSSGETVDKELAARAVEALSSLNSRRFDFSDYESSSDSHWDSEVDFEGDCPENRNEKQSEESEGRAAGTDVVRKRKERRRERNKLSAQAYRQRRREQTAKQQTVMSTLQEENTRLKKLVHNLETEVEQVRNAFRQRGLCTPAPSALPSSSTSPSSTTSATPLDPAATPIPKPSATMTTSTPLNPSPAPVHDTASKQQSMGSIMPSEGFLSFSQLASKEATMTPSLQQQEQKPLSVMDNDPSRRQQISPVVDNFFSRPFPATTTAACSPSPTPSVFKMTTTSTGASAFTPGSALFSVPTSPAKVGAGCSPGLSFINKTAANSNNATNAYILPTISEKPVVHFGRFQHHPQNHHQQQHSSSDLNANMMRNANSNTAFMFCQNDNMNNNNNNNVNNNNVFLGGGGGGGASGVGAGVLAFKFSNSKA